MSVLIGFLYVIEVVVCLLLALVVMLQKPKEGGLGGVIGGGMAEAAFGADAGNVLIKVTIWLGAIFLINTLVLARLTSTIHTKTLMNDVAAPAPIQQQLPDLPAANIPAPAPAPAPAAAPVPVPAPAPAAKPAAPAAPKAPAAPAPAAKPAAPAAPKAPAAPAKK
jgi:preprotein translocase subunit SecG